MPTSGSGSTTAPQGGTSVVRPIGRRGAPALPRRGYARCGPAAGGLAALFGAGTPAYHVYANTGAGDPVNYATVVATVSGTTWTSSPLAAPGTWSFGVRAFDGYGEEQNLDCAVTIALDGNGNDITNRPAPPVGLRAFATAGGGIRAEWFYPPTAGPATPAGFHVYLGTGGPPSYTAPAAAVAFGAGILNTFVANLGGLAGGAAYSIGVRAYNASGEETNTATVGVTADATGPAAVDSLIATAVV